VVLNIGQNDYLFQQKTLWLQSFFSFIAVTLIHAALNYYNSHF